MKALIINYNRLLMPKRTADWCAGHGLIPIIIDNHSTYEPLLEWYLKCPYTIIRLKENYGSHVLWKAPLFDFLKTEKQHILTDPDLDLSGVPDDFLEVMQEGLKRYPEFTKIGLSLEINDLPDSPEGNFIRGVEGKYWRNPLDDRYFIADTDTTFCLRTQIEHTHKALRTNRPYTARHIPWYYTSFSALDAEEQNYFNTAIGGATGGSSGKDRILTYK